MSERQIRLLIENSQYGLFNDGVSLNERVKDIAIAFHKKHPTFKVISHYPEVKTTSGATFKPVDNGNSDYNFWLKVTF